MASFESRLSEDQLAPEALADVHKNLDDLRLKLEASFGSFTLQKGDTLWDIAQQFEDENGHPADLQTLIELNHDIITNPADISRCQFLKLPANWNLKEDASFAHRQRVSRESWPPTGEHVACPYPDVETPIDAGQVLLPMELSGPGLAATQVARLAPSPEGRAEAKGGLLIEMASYLRPGDQITYANAQGQIRTAEFVRYTPGGHPQLRWPDSPRPRYAIGGETIVRVMRGGQELNLYETRLNRYGFSPDAVKSLARFRLSSQELALLERQMDDNPEATKAIEKVLTEARYKKYAEFVRQFKKYGSLTFVCMAIYGFENADDKQDFFLKTATEATGFLAGFQAAEKTVGRLVSHPLIRLGVDITGGIAATMGASRVYRRQVMPALDRYFPNRNQDTAGWRDLNRSLQGLAAATGGAAFEVGDYVLEKMGATTGVTPDTDPLEYLGKTITLFSRGNLEKGIFTDYLTRSLSQFEAEVRSAISRKELTLQRGRPLTPQKRALLEADIAKLKSFLEQGEDGKPEWMSEKIQQLRQADMLLDYLTLQFAEQSPLAQKLRERVERGSRLVESAETQEWKKLVGATAHLPEGDPLTFQDYLAFTRLHVKQKFQMQALYQKGALPGERL